MNTIAIDCGASFVKVALFDEKGTVLKTLQQASPVVHRDEDILSPVQIQALVLLVIQLLDDFLSGEKEAKLCVSNEMHGFILAYPDGTPFTDYISWQKEFGAEKICGQSSVDILSVRECADAICHSGMALRGGLPSSNLLYLHRSGIFEKTSSTLHFYTLGDYLIKRLFSVEPVCHPTNAAATGLYDIVSGAWNQSLIQVARAASIVFPKVGTSKTIILYGNTLVHVYPAIGDQQVALLGAGLECETDLSFNLGTGAQVACLTKKADFSPKWQIRPYFNGFYLKTIPHLPSGRALNVFVRFFKDVLRSFGHDVSDDDLWQTLILQEKRCDGTQICTDLSFFQNPITDRVAGSVANIGEYGLSVGSLMKSVFAQMSENFLAMAGLLLPKANVRRLVFSGGVARRIQSIRDRIVAQYEGCEVAPIIENETLFGLYRYGTEQKLHIIWDLDGTLIDSASEIEETIYRSMADVGLANVAQKSPFRSGPPLDTILDEMYSADVLTAQKKAEIITAFRKNYDNCGFSNTPAFEGIEEILSDNRFVHHIVTNKPDLATNRIIEKLGWKDYFASVITPYSFMKSSGDKKKTKAELFALCMADYPGEKFVGVGDMDTDSKAAIANNIPAIGVLWGTGTEAELRGCKCTRLTQTVAELYAVLKNL